MKEECKPSFFPKIPKKGYFLNFFSYANIQDSFFLLYQNPSEKPDVFRNSSSPVLHLLLGLHCEEDQEVLDDILPAKRQFPDDSGCT